MRLGIAIGLTLGFLTMSSAWASGLRITGLYSDLQYYEDAGDLVGTELLIVPAGGGDYSIFYQIAEGDLPETALIRAHATGKSTIAFNIPANINGGGSYEARIESGGLRLYRRTKGSLSEQAFLKRKKSYWQ